MSGASDDWLVPALNWASQYFITVSMAVYILADRGHNRIKIGYSAKPLERLKAHATSNPGLEVLAILEHGDRRCEKALHRLCRGHRQANTTEWYADSPVLRLVLEDVLSRL